MATIGAHIDAFEYCPDHPDGTVERYRRVNDRRKPGPGMITDLLGRFPVKVDDSILIGDKPSDLEAARAAGLQGTPVFGRQPRGLCENASAAPAHLRAIASRRPDAATSGILPPVAPNAPVFQC
jgi:histidinol phosphatase-like enzyme